MASRPIKRQRLDDAPLEQDILMLVAQRESHRQARNFSESDTIRDQLRAMGVELYDKEKEWRCSDGRRGKLFTAGAENCMWSDEDIQDKVFQREEARKGKDWARADAIRDELRNTGVEVDDKDAVWRTATGRCGTYSGQPVVPASAMPSLGEPAIRKLVAERERLRAGSDFEAADELRRQLASMGVELFDNERMWRSNDGSEGVIITGGHQLDCYLSDMDITSRVMQREEARNAKDWREADAIRDDLRRQGVELLDTQKIWSTADGRQGRYQGGPVGAQAMQQLQQHRAPQRPSSGATQFAPIGQVAPGGQVQDRSRIPSSPVTQSASTMTLSTPSIESLVSGRERARDNRDWGASDAIRADLRAHGVDVWDKEKVWRANDGRTGAMVRLA